MTAKQYCEEKNLDPGKVFSMVLGESGNLLPKAIGFTGYIAEMKDDCLEFTNEKFGVFGKQIPFSAFQKAEFGIGSGQLWLQCYVAGEPFVFCFPRKVWKSSSAKLLLEKIEEHTEILDKTEYDKIAGPFFLWHLIMRAW